MTTVQKILAGIFFLAVLLVIIYWFSSVFQAETPPEDITSFEECVAAGYPILESYPEQCITSDGERFTRDIEEDEDFETPAVREQTIQLYYYDPSLDTDARGNILCSDNGLVAVERTIPVTQTPVQDAVNLLISGELTAQEEATGITTEFPLEGFELEGASLSNGILTLGFSDPNNMTSGGSCRSGILWMQIERTARQFDAVEEVRFQPEELFQP